MAQITKAIMGAHRLEVSLIPEQVLKSIDQAELLDRLVYAEDLAQQAARSQDVTIRRGYSAIAKAVLTAPPRAEVADQMTRLYAQAAGLGPYDPRAATLQRKAAQLYERNPPAPRREDAVPVAKARAARPHATLVYDAAGRVLGQCDPAKIDRSPEAIAKALAPPAGKARATAHAWGRPGRR